MTKVCIILIFDLCCLIIIWVHCMECWLCSMCVIYAHSDSTCFQYVYKQSYYLLSRCARVHLIY